MHYRVKIMALGKWVNDYRKTPYDNLAAAEKRFNKIASDGRQAAIVNANNQVIADTMETGGYYDDPIFTTTDKTGLKF